MSGIVGIVNPVGAPVDRRLLECMTASMSFRGPDAQEVWCEGRVGFGHAMLRTTNESLHERQPLSLDGKVCITADARVDGRSDLIGKLEAKSCRLPETPTDVELLLQAYLVWGEDCLQHLIGDFVFAIWDDRRQRLFCARDQIGVKPFYYARVAGCLIISNTLDCVRQHPAVTDELNDQAVGDFLLWGSNENPETTMFADVQRLPAAHCFTWSAGNFNLKRYWTLPVGGQVRYRRASDYIERFDELLTTAVNDRLRTDRVAVFMSGGIDSPTVAATARKALSRQFTDFDLQAYTVVFDTLIPDEERYYSGLVAEALNIPIHYLVADDYGPYDRWDHPDLRAPEPVYDPMAAVSVDQFRQVAEQSRVALTGQGGDAILRGSFSYVLKLLGEGRLLRLVSEIGRHVRTHRRLPEIGFRTRMRRWLRKPRWEPSYPAWLNPDFAARLNLPARWEEVNKEFPLVHPYRPEAYHYLAAPFWSYLFESYDAGMTLRPVEVRHPLFDLRFLEYTLALPTLPWCVDKKMMRIIMRNCLPASVLRRRKAPLAGDTLVESLKGRNTRWTDRFDPAPVLNRYVDWSAIPSVSDEQDFDQLWVTVRPISLNCWLNGLEPAFNEEPYEIAS